jgi:uroporphyrinogen decarboxylase
VNRKERIKDILSGKLPDFTPYHFDMTMKMTDRLGEYYGLKGEETEDYIGNHLLYLDPDGPNGEENGYRGMSENGKTYFDEFGTEWDVSGNYDIGDWGMSGFPVHDLDFSGYTFPSGKGEGRFTRAKELMKAYPGRFNVMRITGPLTQAWYITGLEDFLMGTLADAAKIEYLLENITRYIIELIDGLPDEVDAVRLIDDYGIQKGLLISKKHWLRFIEPNYRKIVEAYRRKGVHAMHHSCGDVSELMPDFIGLGVEMLDAMQPEAMDIAEIKREYGNDIALFGGMGSQSTIPLGTPDDVRKEAVRLLEALGKGGRYLFGPAGSIPSEAPIDNVVALVEFCKEMQAGHWVDHVS